jgi:hypothetical protein
MRMASSRLVWSRSWERGAVRAAQVPNRRAISQAELADSTRNRLLLPIDRGSGVGPDLCPAPNFRKLLMGHIRG